jgi:hypothetical protein
MSGFPSLKCLIHSLTLQAPVLASLYMHVDIMHACPVLEFPVNQKFCDCMLPKQHFLTSYFLALKYDHIPGQMT